MELARNVLLGLHLLGTVGILVSLLLSRKKLSPGIIHSALLSLLTGIALVGLRYPLADSDPMKWEEIDNTKISLKLIVLSLVLVLGFKNRNVEILNRKVMWAISILTTLNILIAVFW